MTPVEACEPIFLRICELNRIGRTGENCPDFAILRSEMLSLLADVSKTMKADSSLERHWNPLELPLIFFIDSMISESQLPVAPEWNRKRLAYDRKELAGDQKFFDLLNAALADPGVDATARIPVFYTCLGLGFLGMHAGHPEDVLKPMADLAARIDPPVTEGVGKKITPEAYDHVDLRNLIQPKPIKTWLLVALFIGSLLLVLALGAYTIQKTSLQLKYDLKTIQSHSQTHGRSSWFGW
jgi:type VI protein secretion system component VasF